MSTGTKREWLYDQFDVSQPATDESSSRSDENSSTSECESFITPSEVFTEEIFDFNDFDSCYSRRSTNHEALIIEQEQIKNTILSFSDELDSPLNDRNVRSYAASVQKLPKVEVSLEVTTEPSTAETNAFTEYITEEELLEVIDSVDKESGTDLRDPIIIDKYEEPKETYEGELGEFEGIKPVSEEDLKKHREELLVELEKVVAETQKTLTRQQRRDFEKLLRSKLDAFGLDQRVCSMSRLQPIECCLHDNHPSLCEKSRMMNADKLKWLKQKIDDLVRMGMLEVEPNPTYGAPCFVVPKKGPKRYRMVVDMRLLNKYTKPTACELPHLEQQLLSIGTARFFTTMDLLHGFDFLPVHPNSTKYFVMTTPFGAYRMHGSPMGWCNTPALFQARIQQEILLPLNLFCSEGTGICQWIDDSLLYAKDFGSGLFALEQFLDKLIEKNVKINISKCHFFQEEVEFCGRRFTTGGTWTFETKFWDKVTNIPPPRTTTELAQVVYTCQWISNCIPRFATFRDYFEKITGPLNIAKAQLKKRERIIDWNGEHLNVWHSFQELLQSASEHG